VTAASLKDAADAPARRSILKVERHPGASQPDFPDLIRAVYGFRIDFRRGILRRGIIDDFDVCLGNGFSVAQEDRLGALDT
jgi:hypothetical protein